MFVILRVIISEAVFTSRFSDVPTVAKKCEYAALTRSIRILSDKHDDFLHSHHPSDHFVNLQPPFPSVGRCARARARRKISKVGHLLLSRRSIPRMTGTSQVERQKEKDSRVRVGSTQGSEVLPREGTVIVFRRNNQRINVPL